MIGYETIVYTVSNLPQRTELLQRLYNILTTEPDLTYSVKEEKPNKIKVYHNISQDNKLLIRVYIVVVVPVRIDISILTNICSGRVRFNIQETIDELKRNINTLETLSNTRFINGDNNASTLGSLVKALCGTNGEHRTSKTV